VHLGEDIDGVRARITADGEDSHEGRCHAKRGGGRRADLTD
jgi:hypothetical protein